MIPALVPALSLYGFIWRSSMDATDVQVVENAIQGFVVRECLATQSRVYGQLRKRYAVDTIGQNMGEPSPAGTSPPPITVTGTPVRGDLELVVTITTPGPTGIAVFSWQDKSLPPVNGQVPINEGVLSAPSVPLPGTGISIVFPPAPATFAGDNVYTFATPVDDVVLRWIADITTPRVYRKRGWDPTNDSKLEDVRKEDATARAEIEQAANSLTGLFDLPLNADAGGSGISQGGPLAVGETSPYGWQDRQARRGRAEDRATDGDADELGGRFE